MQGDNCMDILLLVLMIIYILEVKVLEEQILEMRLELYYIPETMLQHLIQDIDVLVVLELVMVFLGLGSLGLLLMMALEK